MLKKRLYKAYLRTLLLGLGSALIGVALGFLPYADLLQAAWITLSTIYFATRDLRGRLNEDDEQRFRRLYEERVRLWARRDPEVLKALFSQNLSDKHLRWLDEELGVALSALSEAHALDSLARAGDQPGALPLRAALLLGAWRREVDALPPEGRLEEYRRRLVAWAEESRDLLGEEVAEGVYLRRVALGERRPVGVYLLRPGARLLISVEERPASADEEGRPLRGADEGDAGYSVALSARAEALAHLSGAEWARWRAEALAALPYLERAHGGSGPQRQSLPFFIQPSLRARDLDLDAARAALLRLDALARAPSAPSAETP